MWEPPILLKDEKKVYEQQTLGWKSMAMILFVTGNFMCCSYWHIMLMDKFM